MTDSMPTLERPSSSVPSLSFHGLKSHVKILVTLAE
jgi:hypothetical protein